MRLSVRHRNVMSRYEWYREARCRTEHRLLTAGLAPTAPPTIHLPAAGYQQHRCSSASIQALPDLAKGRCHLLEASKGEETPSTLSNTAAAVTLHTLLLANQAMSAGRKLTCCVHGAEPPSPASAPGCTRTLWLAHPLCTGPAHLLSS